MIVWRADRHRTGLLYRSISPVYVVPFGGRTYDDVKQYINIIFSQQSLLTTHRTTVYFLRNCRTLLSLCAGTTDDFTRHWSPRHVSWRCAWRWDSHGNGNEKHITTAVGMLSVEVGMSKNVGIWLKNSHCYQI